MGGLNPADRGGLTDDAPYGLVIRAATGTIAAIAYDRGPDGDAAMIVEAFPAPCSQRRAWAVPAAP